MNEQPEAPEEVVVDDLPGGDASAPADPAAPPRASAPEPPEGETSEDGVTAAPAKEAAPEDGTDAPGEEAPAQEPVVEEPDWKDRYLRSVAELDNVRKRARRDAAAGEVRGVTRLARELLPALDNLDRALEHVGEAPDAGDDQIVEGLRLIHRELHTALAQAGIESFRPDGQEFDPRFHEALSQQPADEATPAGTVVTVYQAGYRLGDDVLRPAKVVVAG